MRGGAWTHTLQDGHERITGNRGKTERKEDGAGEEEVKQSDKQDTPYYIRCEIN